MPNGQHVKMADEYQGRSIRTPKDEIRAGTKRAQIVSKPMPIQEDKLRPGPSHTATAFEVFAVNVKKGNRECSGVSKKFLRGGIEQENFRERE